MRTVFLSLTALVMLTAQSSASAGQQPQSASKPASPSTTPAPAAKIPVTVTGCLASGADDQFILSDVKNGTYRVKGVQAKSYVGKRVELKGTTSRRPEVTGGLWPNPNVAGQAGAIDPVKAAVAARPGGGAQGTGGEPFPELQATRLRAVKGRCP